MLDHPWLTSAVVLIVTFAFAVQIPRLEVDPSAEGLMLAKDPARAYYEEIKQRFGSDNLTVVLVKADDVFTPEALGAVKRLSDALQRLDGVARVESLTTVKNLRGEGDSINTEPLVGATVPADPAALARIRADALGNRVFVGNLVAADGRATAITVYTEPRKGDREFNRRFTNVVEALIRAESRPGLTLYQIGHTLVQLTVTDNVAHDQALVVPIGIAVLLLVLLIGFRTPQGVVVPVTTALVSIVWALGLMALMKLPLNFLTSIVPSLLIAIGFTEDVHMIADYHHRLEQGDDKPTALRGMLAHCTMPLAVTALTTVVGFGSLIFTDVTMLIQFGWASSAGLLANFVVTMLVLPVALRAWPVPRHLRTSFGGDGRHGLVPRLMDRLSDFNIRHRVAILAVAGGLAAVSLVGWLSLRVDNDFIASFSEKSVVRQRIADLHRTLGGGLTFSVVVETGQPDGIKQPAALRRVAEIQDFLAGTGMIDKSISVADYVRKMHREMHGGDPAFEVVPDNADQIAQYLLMLEGKELAKFVDFNASSANIVVRHNLTGSGPMTELRRRLDAYVASLPVPGPAVRATGEVILTNDAVDFLVINELTSFLGTFVVIGLIHSALFMSLTAGFVSLIPNAVPIICNYGLMGLLGIPLNLTTAMVATIAIGIAVDDTVHHMVTYSRELRQHHDQKVAMRNTLRAQGRPIIFVSMALAASFLVLAFSATPSTVLFGLLCAFVMLLALVGELMLTPVLMYSVRLVTLWDMVLLKMKRDLVKTAPLFYGMSRWEARKVILLGTLQAIEAGTTVIRKGDSGNDMFMVVSGRLRVFDTHPDGREKGLTILESGAIFGEMALVSGDVRSAHVVAEVPCEVLRLDYQALERIRRRFPYTSAKLFRNLARILAARMRTITTAFVTERGDLLAVPEGSTRP